MSETWTRTRMLDLPEGCPSHGWSVSLTNWGGIFSVKLHGPASGDVTVMQSATLWKAERAYDLVTGSSAYVDAYNRAVRG
jgi:hypothetical protein